MDELERMIEEAKRKGLSPESVGSIYQGTPEQIAEHERRNGYEKPWGPKGVRLIQGSDAKSLEGVTWGQQVFTYKNTGAEEIVSRTALKV